MGIVSRETEKERLGFLIEEQLSSWGNEVGWDRVRMLIRYAELLGGYEKANVIGDRGLERIVKRHVLDSLSCSIGDRLAGVRDIVDIGSGGGLPGIPLAILLPAVKVLLVESARRKVTFLHRALRELDLPNVRVWCGRAEDLGRSPEHREAFQVAVSRAVGRLDEVMEYSLPLVERGGLMVAMKREISIEEIQKGERAAARLGGGEPVFEEVRFLPEVGNAGHGVVTVSKVSATPREFPRAPGKARKKPLGG